MDTADLLRALEAEGATIGLAGRRLQIRGHLSAATAEEARAQRDALVALVRRRRLEDIVASRRRLSDATAGMEAGSEATLAAGRRWMEAARRYHAGEAADASELIAAEREALAAWAALSRRPS